MGWDEIEIENIIKSNRNFLEKEIGKCYSPPALFINPTKENPVETSEFLSHLDLSFLDQTLKEMFPRLERIKKSVYARIKFVVFMKLKGIKSIKKGYRLITINKEIAENLGFNPGNLPSYETIRHFINDLLPEKIEEIFYAVVKEIAKELEKRGKWEGKLIEDATVITAKRGEKEAEYNDYYETKGWKKDLLIDSNGIFLSFRDMEINENEGIFLEYHLKKLNDLGIFFKHITADGKYATYYNISVVECHYGIEFLYRIQEGWKYNEKGDERYIKRRYSKYWKEKVFNPNASIDEKLKFLYRKGEYEVVGAYYRNKMMKRWEENESIRENYSKLRNKNEYFNSFIKQHAGFETDIPRKGRYSAFFHTTLCLLSLNLVALTKLQNGVTENLISVVYLV